jgi:hypothetical protein
MLCLALLSLTAVLPSSVLADQSGAANAISSARNQLVDCYAAAEKAEAAGANITTLTGTLNEAGLLLSQAELAFSNGDFTSAQNYAVQSQSRLTDLVSEASTQLSVAESRRNRDFTINVVGSTGGTIAVLAGSFGLWFFLKKKYKSDGGREFGSATV